MKQYARFICLFIALLGLFRPVYANDDLYSPRKSTGIYVQSLPVPDEVVLYMKQNIGRFLDPEFDKATIGTPFSIHNLDIDKEIYYFPIITRNTVIATYRVAQYNNQYTGVYSNVLSKELNSLSTTINNPAFFYAKAECIIMVQGNKRSIVLSCGNSLESNLCESLQQYNDSFGNYITVNCLQSVYTATPNQVQERAILSSYYTVPFATTACSLEQQPNTLPWCSAYVAAFIVRCRSSNSTTPTAYDVMTTVYPYETYVQLSSHALWDSDARMYYQGLGYTATLLSSYLSNSTVISYINTDKPIHMLTAKLTPGANHSIALVGYNTPNATYKVWNPWYSYLELMDQTLRIYTAPTGDQYEWMWTITVS